MRNDAFEFGVVGVRLDENVGKRMEFKFNLEMEDFLFFGPPLFSSCQLE